MITIVDACCAINLSNARVLGLVLGASDRRWAVGPRVLDECTGECGQALRVAISSGRVSAFDDEHIPASVYLSLLGTYGLGEGETECLAIATSDSDVCIATDDRRARSTAINLFGKERLTGSLGILRDCAAHSTLSGSDAFAAYRLMIEAGAFLPKIEQSFFV